MPDVAADRNLLMGILALQLDFIDRDQLIAAMHTWVLDKSRALDAILSDQGVLTDDTRALLGALVEKHLGLHGHRVEKSLASLSSLGSVRRQLQSIEDAGLQASLSHVASERAVDADATPPLVGAPSGVGTRFRILRPHARGGLGEVSVARDSELNREVALKEIQRRHAYDPHSRARFLLEAEITGSLEHPGIVPVYGLGKYDDGRPFYAMRFIRGDSLNDAIRRFHHAGADRSAEERRLELRQLLGRFTDVCNAIGYAHSRGVLHRDLKPGNIMLGKYGETLVVDWGLAKAAGRFRSDEVREEPTLRPSSASGSAPTEMGSAIGTPAYMSPEQAAGQLDRLGPASDVYSLGATLYSVLTGHPPFEEPELPELLRKVQTGHFVPPRQRRGDVPAALDAVCCKAMALDPDQRFESPGALAEEIERWLGDEPVASYPEPLRDRLARWARKHRGYVSATVAALAVSVVALAAIAVLLEGARSHSETQRLRIADARRQAEDNWREATRHRRLAEANFELAMQSVDRYHTAVSQNELLNVPGLQPLRRELLMAAREFYERFAEQARSDARVRRELGHAQMRLSMITREIASTEEAIQLARSAITTFESIEAPLRVDDALARAKAHSQLGLLYNETGASAKAEVEYLKSLEVLGGIRDEHEHRAAVSKVLANLHNAIGVLYYSTNRMEEAEKHLSQSLDAGLREEHPGLSATAHYNLALIHDRAQRWDDAERAWRHALVDALESVRRRPNQPGHANLAAQCHHNLGNLHFKQGRFPAARKAYLSALEMKEKIAQAHPAVIQFQRDLAHLYNSLSLLSSQQDERTQALEYLQKAIRIREQLVADNPEQLLLALHLAHSYLLCGKNARRDDQPEAALRWYDKSVETYDRVQQREPNYMDLDERLLRALLERAEFLRELDRTDAARMDLRRATELGRRATDTSLAISLGYELAQFDQYRDAAGAIQQLVDRNELDGRSAYNAACVFAVCAAAVSGDKGLAQAEREPLAEQYMATAESLLRRADQSGFFTTAHVKHLQQDSDLDSLRGRATFEELRREIERGTDGQPEPVDR